MNDVDAAEQWLDSWVSQVDARAQQAVELSRRVAGLLGSAEGRDRAIRVTVGSAGQVEALELDDRVRELSGPRLAREIVAVMRRAQAVLSAEVVEQVRVTVGADSGCWGVRGDLWVSAWSAESVVRGRCRGVERGSGCVVGDGVEAAGDRGDDRGHGCRRCLPADRGGP